MYEKFFGAFEKVMREAGYVKINIPADLVCASPVDLWAREHGSMVYFYLTHDLRSMNWANFDVAKTHMDKAMETIAQRVSARHSVAFNIFVGDIDFNAEGYINSTREFGMDERYDLYVGVGAHGLQHSSLAPVHMDKAKFKIETALRTMNIKAVAFEPLTPPVTAPAPAPPQPQRTYHSPEKREKVALAYRRNMSARPAASMPIFAVIIIVVNVFIWLMMEIVGGGSTDTITLLQYGAVLRPAIVQGGEWYRLVTSMFLHIGWMHLLMNTMFLILAGIRSERHFGHLKFLIIYFVAGVAGSFAMMMLSAPLTVGAGASGAIFGLMGAMLAYMLVTKRPIETFTAQNLGFMVLINLGIGFAIPEISNSAHIGGLVAGFILGYVFTVTGKQRG